MLNFYRRFIPNAASTQAPLHDILSGPRVNSTHPITWTDELNTAFNACKESLAQAAFLAHPHPTAPLALVTDASTAAMGAVLQQRVQDNWLPIAFFSRMSPAQQKYSAYDRELFAIYEAVRYFRHMLEAQHFTIYTDHKPLINTFLQKKDKCSPRQFHHLDFIAQFSTDIRHICGQENIVVDTPSRIEAITTPVSHDTLATVQANDEELRKFLARDSHAARQNLGTRYLSRSVLRHIPQYIMPIRSVFPSPSSILLLTFTQSPRYQGNSENSFATFCLAINSEGLQYLDQCLPILPTILNFSTHYYPNWQLPSSTRSLLKHSY